MELYTDLMRLKQEMNGGVLPAMTPYSESVARVLDPSFGIGLGALVESPERGLRCPVRDCGSYYHSLAHHLTSKHADLGGAIGIKMLLEIPKSVKLLSLGARSNIEKSIASRLPQVMEQARIARCRGANAFHSLEAIERKTVTQRINRASAGMRNLTNRCEAQMRHRMIDLQNRIGRSPSLEDARVDLGHGFVKCVIAVYGSWNAAKLRFDIAQYRPGQTAARKTITRESVLVALRLYYASHGVLPTLRQANFPDRAPLIPSVTTIRRVMGTGNWSEAMRRAASLLNIYGGRYGLPEKARPLASPPSP